MLALKFGKKMTAFKDYCINIFSYVRPQATFLSVKEYKNNYYEVADFTVCFHANYLNAVSRSLEIVDGYSPSNDIEAIARDEMIESFRWTLNGFNPLYTCQDVYEDILDADGKPIPGIKLHKRQDSVHINAMRVRKNIISKGLYPDRDSADKTIAKRILRAKTPIGNWLQFKLEPKRFKELTVQKMRING